MYRKWIANDKTIESESKITFYDAGAYLCVMLGETYNCWEVVSREKDANGYIIELLEPVHGDWVPFDIISSESYPVNLIERGYEITGWTITLEPSQEAQLPRPSQQAPLLYQQPRQPPYQLPNQSSQRGQQRPSQRPQQHQGLPGRPFQQPQRRLQQQPSQQLQKPRQQPSLREAP